MQRASSEFAEEGRHQSLQGLVGCGKETEFHLSAVGIQQKQWIIQSDLLVLKFQLAVSGDAESVLVSMGGGGEGEGRKNGESGMEMCILPYVNQIASGDLLYDAENSDRDSDHLEAGRKIQEGGSICTSMVDSY